MMIRALSLFAVMVMAMSTPVKDAHAYGAVASEHGTTNWYVDWNYKTVGAATSAALAKCGSGCSIGGSFSDACVAMAVGDKGRTWAISPSLASAKKIALAACKKTTTGCLLKAGGCDTKP